MGVRRFTVMGHNEFHTEAKARALCAAYRTLFIYDEVHERRTRIKYEKDEVDWSKEPKDGKFSKSFVDTLKQCPADLLLLTATPIVNKRLDLLNLLDVLDHDFEFHRLRATYRRPPVEWMRRHVYVVTYDHPDRPRTRERIVRVPMSEDFYQTYMRVERAVIERDAGFMTKLRQSVNSIQGLDGPKLDRIVAHISDLMANDRSVMIYTSWNDAGVARIRERLRAAYGADFRVPAITGRMNNKQRVESIRMFNERRAKVLVVTDAGATGVDLKNSGCRDVIVMDATFNYTKYYQAISRVVRVGALANLPPDQRIVEVTQYVTVKPPAHDRDSYKASDELVLAKSKQKKIKEDEYMAIIQADAACIGTLVNGHVSPTILERVNREELAR